MKRPPGLWILLLGTLFAILGDVYAVRATSLIFGKSPTTTTTTTVASVNETDRIDSDVEAITETNKDGEIANVTKPPLTGNPQIDYIYDLNLPKELNGYNLSEYPFYERVPDPDTIDFKCDGLHDGFYASIPLKCQVYHHCLFGVRYDFLCANYTAFDQKTFICQFVSEVDCENSKKFWHRNDALYQAATTTTVKPQIIYTPPSEPNPVLSGKGPSGRGGGKRRRPLYRRPQYDYYEDEEYDDYYEDRPRSRRRRPRPRPRPIYEDEYEDDYEDAYEMRRRRPTRPDRKRNKNRNKYKDEEDDYDREEDQKTLNRHENKHEDRQTNKRKHNRPTEESLDDDYDLRPSRPKKGHQRPSADEYEDEEVANNKNKNRNRPRKKDNQETQDTKPTEQKAVIKPNGSSIYDRPRTAPRIKPPVPKNEADKYAYKPLKKQPSKESNVDEEYYDDYEEELPKKKSNRRPESTRTEIEDVPKPKKNNNRSRPREFDDSPINKPKEPKRPSFIKDSDRNRSRQPQRNLNNKETKEVPVHRPSNNKNRQSQREPPKPKPKQEEYEYEDYELSRSIEDEVIPIKKDNTNKIPSSTERVAQKITTKITSTTPKITTYTNKENKEIWEKPEQVVRIVKRPFLPSRGGNPYSSRGLEPVGIKAQKSEVMEQQSSIDIHQKSGPVAVANNENTPFKSKFGDPISDDDDNFKPVKPPHIRLNLEHNGPRTTQKPKLVESKDPLDIIENEYDVTLNDALNPTLSNIPVRGYPVGFSQANDYTFGNHQRSRYVLEPVISSANNDHVYQQKNNRQRFESTPQGYTRRDQFVSPSTEFRYFNAPVANPHSNTPNRLTQANTQAYYTGY